MIHAFTIFMPPNIPCSTKLEITRSRSQNIFPEFLAFLDVDDWWENNKLSLQVPFFEDETVGLVCGKYKVFYEDSKWSRSQWKDEKPSGFILNELLEDYHIGLLTIMIRRSTFEKLGGFDSRYHVIGDFDISFAIYAESF